MLGIKTNMKFKNKWVVVTGASSGLGYEMAIQFAKTYQANVILVARRKEKLEQLQQKLIDTYKVQCKVITADLTIDADVQRVFDEATAIADIYAVVLNAGITYFGEHKDLEWSYFEKIIATNLKSVVKLTDLFTPYLISKKQKGGILYVASMAGLTAVPYQAVYSGTKAFVINFVTSLQQEIKKEKISLTVYAPGGIDTELTTNTGLDYFNKTGLIQSAEECAIEGIQGFKARKLLKIPGIMNQAQIALSRVLPRSIVNATTARTYKMALKNKS